MSRHSFRRVNTYKAQADGRRYIAYVMDDFGNDVAIDTAKVNYSLIVYHA